MLQEKLNHRDSLAKKGQVTGQRSSGLVNVGGRPRAWGPRHYVAGSRKVLLRKTWGGLFQRIGKINSLSAFALDHEIGPLLSLTRRKTCDGLLKWRQEILLRVTRKYGEGTTGTYSLVLPIRFFSPSSFCQTTQNARTAVP